MDGGSLSNIKTTTLAYAGDAVFTLYVRLRFCADPHLPPRELMRKCATTVSAVMQARIYDGLAEFLTEDERELTHRCENTHLVNKAKNATMREYRKATALEGLFGALKLSGSEDRLNELLDKCMEIINE